LTTPVPRLPLLAPWYRLVGDDDRLLLEHGQTVVVVEGAAVRTLLPALLPLLDGTRSVEELGLRLGLAARPAIDLALETLAAHGLLVDGPDAPPDVRTTARAVATAEWGEYLAAIEEAPTAACADPGFDAFVVALSAHLAIRWVAGGDTSLPGVLFAVEGRPVPSIGEHAVVRVPRCPACSPVERLARPLPWHEAAA
jgi:hypothetical protein